MQNLFLEEDSMKISIIAGSHRKQSESNKVAKYIE